MNADMTLGKDRTGYGVRRDRGLFDAAVVREGLGRTGTLAVIMGIITWISAILTPVMRSGYYEPDNPILLGPVQANPMILLCFTVFAPFLTMKAFDFLNSRAGSDLFHAMPVKRRTVAAGFLSAVTVWLALIIGGGILVSMASCGMIAGVRLDTSRLLIFFLQMLSASILVEMSVFLAMTVTGTVLSNIVMALGLIFLPRFLITTAGLMLADRVIMLDLEHLPLFFTNRLNIVAGIVFDCFLQGMFGSGSRNVLYYWPSVLYTLVLAAIYAAIGCALYVRRPSETAGRPALGSRLQCAARIGIGFLITVPAVSAVGGGYSPENLSDYATLLALFLAGFGATFVYEYISARRLLSWKQFLGGILGILLLDALWIGAGCLAGKIISGERIPAERIESVSFTDESWSPASLVFNGEEGFAQDYWGMKLAGMSITDESILQLVSLRHEQTAKGTEIRSEVEILSESEQPPAGGDGETYEEQHDGAETYMMECRINLKGGKDIYRRLCFTRADIEAVWQAVIPRIGSTFLELPGWGELHHIYEGNDTRGEFYGWELHEAYETFRGELSDMTPEEWFRILTDPDSYGGDVIEFVVLSGESWHNGTLPVTEAFPGTLKVLRALHSQAAEQAQTESEAEGAVQTEADAETESDSGNRAA